MTHDDSTATDENPTAFPWEEEVDTGPAPEDVPIFDHPAATLRGFHPKSEETAAFEEVSKALTESDDEALERATFEAFLDDLAEPEDLRRVVEASKPVALDVVRRRADARRAARLARLDGDPVASETDLRREAVGASDDADVLAGLASIFAAAATEAKAIAGDLLDDLPPRGTRARASLKVADGRGFELIVSRTKRSELSVDHEAVDDVLATHLVAGVEGTLTVALERHPLKVYADGFRDGVASLRSILASSPAYRSTALDALVKAIEDTGNDDLARRLRKAYGKVDKGEASVKLERKPIETKDAAQ